ncbi:MAG: hypothetical protein ACOCXI_13245, partial [Chloroflexota bacterium]
MMSWQLAKRGDCVLLLGVALLLLTGFTTGVLVQEGLYTLDRTVVAGGGETFSSGGAYTLGGTAGQAAAGDLSGGDYTLMAGFWHGNVIDPPPPETSHAIYLPVV